jgi:hypothetical protein
MIVLASQFELAVGNPLHEVNHVPGDQSSRILNNLRTNADMALRNGLNGLFIKSADVPGRLFTPTRTFYVGNEYERTIIDLIWKEENSPYPQTGSFSVLSPSQLAGASGK